MFEQYIGTRGRKTGNGGVPYVSFYPGSKLFYFSTQAAREYNLQDYNYCSLFYDKGSNKIGFKFHKEREKGSYKLTKIVGRQSIYIPGPKYFFDKINPDIDLETLKGPMTLESEKGFLVAQLPSED